MENDVLLREVYGLDPSEFTIERYRTAEQGVNENGRACRISHRSGNVVCVDRESVYAQNEATAIVLIASNLALAEARRPNTPILELIAQYEAECCDFEDGKWMARTALRLEPAMADSQLRALVFGLANIVAGTPYRRPKAAKVPVAQVEELATWLKHHKKAVIQSVQGELNLLNFEMSTSIRTSTLQSGIVKRLYGKMTVRAQHKIDPYATKRHIAKTIQELAGLDYTPALYTTSGSSYTMAFNSACASFARVRKTTTPGYGTKTYNV